MKDRPDKREHRRLSLEYNISCSKVGAAAGESYAGRVVNVSSGGVYFRTAGTFGRGELLRVALEIPPTAGLLEFGGKLAAYARVLRAEGLSHDQAREDTPGGSYGVAAQFCRPPRLWP